MKKFVLFSILFAASAASVCGQNKCLSAAEAKKIVASLDAAPPRAADETLRREMLSMREEREKLNRKIFDNFEKNQNLVAEANRTGERHLLRVCSLLKTHGWLGAEALRDDGFAAFKFLLAGNKAFEAQRELFPVLVEAAKRRRIENPLLAQMIDTIRVNAGLPQIFGTEATIRDRVIYLYPLADDRRVNAWRKSYDLPPLIRQIQSLEMQYAMPVLKMPPRTPPPAGGGKQADDQTVSATTLGIGDEAADDVLKIETKLVNLNVRLFAANGTQPSPPLDLTRADFVVAEDGVEQEIAFFSNNEQPFDLILLLDFSGSTVEKRGVIKKAAQRFVAATRQTDRIAVVAFTDQVRVVAALSTDKNLLAEKIKNIEMTGGSAIWDAVQFAYQNIVEKESAGRRSAVVLMTDAEDHSYETPFADLIETVRRGDATVFSIYIESGGYGFAGAERFQRKNQQMMRMLADESGGQYYKADSAKDLNGIYEQIAGDLGKVYSLGYEPKNDARGGGSGSWRTTTVKLRAQPNVVVKTRRGYYSN